MNDLYLETAKPNRDDEENGRADIDCSDCAEPLNIFDGEVVVVSKSDDQSALYCHRCAERLAAAFPGVVHDRREDAEVLLREATRMVHAALAGGGVADPETATRLSTLANRMARR